MTVGAICHTDLELDKTHYWKVFGPEPKLDKSRGWLRLDLVSSLSSVYESWYYLSYWAKIDKTHLWKVLDLTQSLTKIVAGWDLVSRLSSVYDSWYYLSYWAKIDSWYKMTETRTS